MLASVHLSEANALTMIIPNVDITAKARERALCPPPAH